MSSDAVNDSIYVVEAVPHLQPIRLPAEAFQRLHRVNSQRLDAFVAAHLERFPQQAGGWVRKR
ncbi:hypothetical protein [Botrimarina hoheduenensis]|uniref:Uncharacterized protein n=1 Tax=Botrimarina hoheduenensis TaxID=2528000 RepID=A0A5C5W0E5_9BACT|nr:hypothetical protein [Botrimarina hoheduenensis]TWT43242.1 hypothetical protein Pla111_21920 [Botrimarina hoheduenensis]